MLDLALKIKAHIESRIREMISRDLTELRFLEDVSVVNHRRSFLTGKIAAYDEILVLIKSDDKP